MLTDPFLLETGDGSALFLGEDVGVEPGVLLTSSVDPQLLRRTACCNPADDAWMRDVNARALLLLLPVEFREKFPSESPEVVSRSVKK